MKEPVNEMFDPPKYYVLTDGHNFFPVAIIHMIIKNLQPVCKSSSAEAGWDAIQSWPKSFKNLFIYYSSPFNKWGSISEKTAVLVSMHMEHSNSLAHNACQGCEVGLAFGKTLQKVYVINAAKIIYVQKPWNEIACCHQASLREWKSMCFFPSPLVKLTMLLGQ